MPLNKKLLNKVKKHILAEPKRLFMSTWYVKGTPGKTQFMSEQSWGETQISFANCGMAGCIAGWTCILGLTDEQKELQQGLDHISISQQARALLGITSAYERLEPFELFYVNKWPLQQQREYLALKDTYNDNGQAQKRRAEIVAEVIDLFKKGYDEFEKRQKAVTKEKEYFRKLT